MLIYAEQKPRKVHLNRKNLLCLHKLESRARIVFDGKLNGH